MTDKRRRRQIKKAKRVIKLVNRLICVIATIGIIIAAATFGTMKVKANKIQAQTEASYRAFEKSYKTDVRNYLNEIGLDNAGLTLTSVTDEKGIRTYKVSIHHKRMAKFDNAKRAEINRALAEMAGLTENYDTDVTTTDSSELVCEISLSNII